MSVSRSIGIEKHNPTQEKSPPERGAKPNQINQRIVTSELVINVQPQEVSIAITEDKLLMEFHKATYIWAE